MKIGAWKDVPGWEGTFLVSDNGRIWSVRRFCRNKNGGGRHMGGRELKPYVDKNGYHHIDLQHEGRVERHCVHRLVLRAFVSEPMPKEVCMHIDNNPSNNRVGNLKWGTHRENMLQASRDGLMTRGESHSRSKLSERDVIEIRKLHRDGVKQKEIARIFGVGDSNINLIIKGRNWEWLKEKS